MNSTTLITYLAWGILLLGFIAMIIVGLKMQIAHSRRVNSNLYTVVEGKVVKLEEIKSRSGNWYAPIYEYIAHDGKTYHFKLESLTTIHANIGDTKELIYLNSDPKQCEPRQSYAGLLFVAVGIFCILAIFYAYYQVNL